MQMKLKMQCLILQWKIFLVVYVILKVSLCTECNFDVDLCSWSHDDNSYFNWTRQKGPTPSGLTGPDADHTSGDGHYIYIESFLQKQGEKARLISSMQPYGGFCLIFWYSMFGTGIGSLNVYMKSGSEIPLFSQNNSSENNKWIKAAVSKYSPTDFQIIFEGTVGDNVKGDIAIDDITLTTGFCSPACNFDDGLCNWRQDQSDDFDWTRQTGQTKTVLTGPQSDHSKGNNGYYIYIETSYPRVYGDKARLICPMQASGQYCWTLWYSMFGKHINKLSVYIKTKSCPEILIFSKENGTNRTDWMKVEINLQTISEYEIIIEGVRGNGLEGDIAVDDITMTNDTCETVSAFTVNVLPSCQTQRLQSQMTKATNLPTNYETITKDVTNITTPVPVSQSTTAFYTNGSSTDDGITNTTTTITFQSTILTTNSQTSVKSTENEDGHTTQINHKSSQISTSKSSSSSLSTSFTSSLSSSPSSSSLSSSFTSSLSSSSSSSPLSSSSSLSTSLSSSSSSLLSSVSASLSSSSSSSLSPTSPPLPPSPSSLSSTSLSSSLSSLLSSTSPPPSLSPSSSSSSTSTSPPQSSPLSSSSSLSTSLSPSSSSSSSSLFSSLSTSLSSSTSSLSLSPTSPPPLSPSSLSSTSLSSSSSSSSTSPPKSSSSSSSKTTATTTTIFKQDFTTVKIISDIISAEPIQSTLSSNMSITHTMPTMSDMTAESGDKVVYILITIVFVVLVIVVSVSYVIWRQRKRSKLTFNERGRPGYHMENFDVTEIDGYICERDIDDNQGPAEHRLSRENDYTEVFLDCKLLQDAIIDDYEIHNCNSQNDYVTDDNKHIYNHLEKQKGQYIDKTYSKISDLLADDMNNSLYNFGLAISEDNKTYIIQGQGSSTKQPEADCYDTYSRLQTSKFNTDTELLSEEDPELDIVNQYNTLKSGGASKKVRTKDDYYHPHQANSSKLVKVSSYPYARVIKQTRGKNAKDTNCVNITDGNIDVSPQLFEIQDTDADTCPHDYFILEKV